MPLVSRTFLITAFAAAYALTAPPAWAAEMAHPEGNGAPAPASSENLDTALFAGGSFWYLEAMFEALAGVDSATAGYMSGQETSGQRARGPGEGPIPDFESVSTGNTPYVEAVRVLFHPKKVTYAKLLEAFWKNIDPTRADGQFSDDGSQFRTFVFTRNEAQRKIAEASRKKLSRSKRFSKPIVTGIAAATVFHPAEAEHQDYYQRNAPRYKAYVKFSGREAFFKKAWGAAGTRVGKGMGAAAK